MWCQAPCMLPLLSCPAASIPGRSCWAKPACCEGKLWGPRITGLPSVPCRACVIREHFPSMREGGTASMGLEKTEACMLGVISILFNVKGPASNVQARAEACMHGPCKIGDPASCLHTCQRSGRRRRRHGPARSGYRLGAERLPLSCPVWECWCLLLWTCAVSAPSTAGPHHSPHKVCLPAAPDPLSSRRQMQVSGQVELEGASLGDAQV